MEDLKKEDVRYKGFKSIKTNVILMCCIAMLLTGIICVLIAVPSYRRSSKSTVQSDMKTIANSYGMILDYETANKGELTVDDFSSILGNAKISSLSSSYTYLVSPDGTMLYHPTASKIGQPVENEAVKKLVAEIKTGNIPKPDLIEYMFKGKMKYAAYYIEKDSNNIMVLTADEADVYAPATRFMWIMIIAVIVSMIIVGIIVIFLSGLMLKPLVVLNKVIKKTSEFNFEHNPDADQIIVQANEFGQISRAIHNMRANLREIVVSINDVSESLNANSLTLKEVTTRMNDDSSDNSATSEELAAGMEETSATTETINENVSSIADNAEKIKGLSESGMASATEIQEKAAGVKDNVFAAAAKTREIYADVKEQSDEAIEQSKAVNQINELTETIKSIAGQTNLLALNASIEAARAGEAGRGFAVVAEEIGHLANQSSDTVSGINDIVDQVHKSVENMSECLAKALEFLEKNVTTDYDTFENVAEQYAGDAKAFEESMNTISSSIEELNQNIEDITGSISGISSTIGESAKGVTDIAQKTTDIVALTSQTSELVDENLKYSDDMKEMVGKFVLGE